MLLRILLLSIIVFILAFVVFWKMTAKKRLKNYPLQDDPPKIDLSIFNLSAKEKELYDLLFTESTIKQIALSLDMTVSGVNFRAKNLFNKLGIKNRTELFVKFGKMR